MRIKHNAQIAITATIAADEFGIKPSRAGWAVRAEQVERLARILEADDRPSTHKVKRGVQAVMGRVRVERAEVKEVIEADDRPIRVIYAEMLEVVRSMQEFAAANQPAWIQWELDRYGRGLVVMASPWNNVPCPICSTYEISEEGLDRLQEDAGWLLYCAVA